MFSVVIPYYKKRQYIERCLDAVFAQTYQDYEIILVDDGSQDDIKEFVESKYSDKVNLIHQENQGVSAARNTGIAAATHDYIAFLDADDCWSSYYLESVQEVILNEGEVKIIGCKYSRTKNDIAIIKPQLKYRIIKDYFSKQVFENTLFTSSSSIINRSFFSANLGFNVNLKRGEDLDVWFRAIASGGKVIYIENILVYYSDEDVNQVTLKKVDFKFSVLSIMANEYNDMKSPIILKKFSKIFIRKRIYPYFFDSFNHEEAKNKLKQIGYGNLFSNILYRIPFKLGEKIIKQSFIRYYSKYLIK